jgi:hypothetical protein
VKYRCYLIYYISIKKISIFILINFGKELIIIILENLEYQINKKISN